MSLLKRVDSQLVSQGLHGERLRLVYLVAEDQEGDPSQRGPREQVVQLASGHGDAVAVGGVHHVPAEDEQ